MSRPLPKLDEVPKDHKIAVTTWTLANNYNSDSVVEARDFVAGSSIVVQISNVGVFVKVTVSDGVGESSQNLANGDVLIVQSSGLGEKVAYRIKVKAENLTNKLTAAGASLSVFVSVFTVPASPPIPSFPRPKPPAPPVTPPPAPPRTHLVKPNEYLRQLAELYYGDANQWKTIYDANKGIVGTNANLIFAGQRLIIP